MRDDMAKVIVERPRWGSRAKTPNHTRLWQRTTLDERPARAPMRRTDKWLNEYLSPLKRFLEKSAGRAWNDVHSELASHIDRGNVVQAHIWQHIKDFVEIHVVEVVQGEPYSIGYRGLGPAYSLLYVDPETGLLKANPRRRRRYKRRPPNPPMFRKIAENLYVGRIHDNWFEIRTASIDAAPIGAREALRGRTIDPKPDSFTRRAGQGLYGSRDLYAVAKRSLNSKEIKALALVSDESRPSCLVRR